MGAWIETLVEVVRFDLHSVAPLVGAWIETCHSGVRIHVGNVAPLVGAWIETATLYNRGTVIISRSPCGSVD